MRKNAKKILAILLGVSFLVSLTATTVSAIRESFDPTWGPISKQNYNNAYPSKANEGSTIGILRGLADGRYDCRSGAIANSGKSWKYHRGVTSSSAEALGVADGYNDYLDYRYKTFYHRAYGACIVAGEQNVYFKPPPKDTMPKV